MVKVHSPGAIRRCDWLLRRKFPAAGPFGENEVYFIEPVINQNNCHEQQQHRGAEAGQGLRRFRAVLVAFTAFVTLVSADHDLNMQCKVKVKFVAIDTPDENGGLARTSFLYVEVEADQKIYVEPESCPPEGYVPPMTVYEINCFGMSTKVPFSVRSRGFQPAGHVRRT